MLSCWLIKLARSRSLLKSLRNLCQVWPSMVEPSHCALQPVVKDHCLHYYLATIVYFCHFEKDFSHESLFVVGMLEVFDTRFQCEIYSLAWA